MGRRESEKIRFFDLISRQFVVNPSHDVTGNSRTKTDELQVTIRPIQTISAGIHAFVYVTKNKFGDPKSINKSSAWAMLVIRVIYIIHIFFFKFISIIIV